MGTYEPCVLGSDGNCTRWSHDHAADRPSVTDNARAEAEWVSDLARLAEKQAAAHARMLELVGGIGLLGIEHPDMFEDMLAWGEATANDHADTVLRLIAALAASRATGRAEATTEEWEVYVATERAHQRIKWGDDHDRQHGVDHLLALAQDYGRRGKAVKAAALVQAARDLLAAGRAETTTATTEDAARVINAELVRQVRGELIELVADDDMECERSIARALDARGLLATARTRPTETTTEWGVRFYGRGPFDMPCEDRDDAEAEVDQVEDKHAPAVLIRREVTAWTEAE